MNILRLGTRMYWILELVRQTGWAGLTTGSGILSFMSAQAGAKQVIALEASSMADKMAVVRSCSTDMPAREGIKQESKEPTYEEQNQNRQGNGGR
jgi:predicted RNA methylase